MATHQSQAPPPPPPSFSPAQMSPSPSNAQPPYVTGQPPAKRPRVSPSPTPMQPTPQPVSQPLSPYPTTSYAQSPRPIATPRVASPGQPPMSLPGGLPAYNNPYQNGNPSPGGLSLPSPQPLQTPTVVTPAYSPTVLTPSPTTYTPPAYSTATLAPIGGPTTPVIMGPPSKPPERPAKEYQYEVDDSLAGTGIDLRQEEEYQANYYAKTVRPEARTGFAINPPGDRASFYGAGPANQPGQPTSASQVDFQLETAKQAWSDSARALAVTRSQEVRQPFLMIPILHARAEKIAREYGIGLNLDPRQSAGLGRMPRDYEFPKPRVTVKTVVGPDGAIVSTSGSFIPEDSYLADQIALLSIAAKQRVRELLEEVNKVAVTRQQTSHGKVPEEWLDAAAPLPVGEAAAASQDANTRVGNESAVSPRTNPLKRPADTKVDSVAQIATTNVLAQSLREVGKTDRDWEEARLRKRQKREDKTADPGSASRSGSVAPGTPGAVAPEPEKPPTKKEQKAKTAAAKAAEASSNTTSANRTSLAFLGKRKQYSWMSQGGSGASTPTRPGLATQGLAGSAGGAQTPRAAEPQQLTSEGRTRLGTFREDGDKGKDIQLRDWVVVLEEDGRDIRALQEAYDKLDAPAPRQST